MNLFIGLGLVLLVAVAVCFLLWRQESRAADPHSVSWSGLALPLLVVALAALGYLTLGYHPQTRDWIADQHRYADVADRVIRGEAPGEQDQNIAAGPLARVLQARLVRDHQSAPGWYTLGLLYDQLGAPAQVQEAAGRAVRLAPDNPSARLLLARGMIEQAQGRLTDPAQAQIQTVLDANPDHDGAWMLQAMAAGEAHRYQLAADSWRALLARHGEGEAGDLIRQGLARAEQQMASSRRFDDLRVRVSATDVPAGGTLFVFLQREGGGGQPLAARRMLVETFPATVELRPQDWLQPYPDDPDTVRAAARYTPAPGSSVAEAGLRSDAVPINPDGSPAASVTIENR
ncbi:cytochrome C biogenesis protein [Alcanivorax sp. N3-2A]|nr:cytochrome C biogenesis protein [Alcanivorax sp. N3-2A]|tara:strand:- start:13689 stop:14723 length:1035 start_codon:yes stop_codon:yes gene_type:complete